MHVVYMDNVFCQIKFNCNRLSKRRLDNEEDTGKGFKFSMFIEARKLVSTVGSLVFLGLTMALLPCYH